MSSPTLAKAEGESTEREKKIEERGEELCMTTPKKALIGKLTYSSGGRRNKRSSEKKVTNGEGEK